MKDNLLVRDLSPTEKEAWSLAKEVRKNASAPYSNFHVAAVVTDENGNMYTGCNVESASYGATICAERTALTKMISEGGKRITAVLVLLEGGDTDNGTPCGICRQLTWDYSAGNKDVVVTTVDAINDFARQYTIGELLPYGFELKK